MTTSEEIKYSIVIPCFNEKDNIPLLLEKFSECLADFEQKNASESGKFELILVDNGSTDGTLDLLNSITRQYNFCSFLHLKKNLGYGGGIKSGLDNAKGIYIGWTHADLQSDPSDVFKAFKICDKYSESPLLFVKGRRRKRKIVDRIFSRGMSIFESLIFFSKYDDINAQPNIFSRAIYHKASNIPKDFSFDLYFYYLAKKLRANIVRFDVLFPDRIFGESKWNTGFLSRLKFIRRTLIFSVKLRKSTIL